MIRLRTAAAAALLAAAYVRLLRPRVLNWGATREEVAAPLAGDELLDGVALQTTRAVTVEAGPDSIWPWLVQMGPRPRAGVYTYDWIERLLGIDIRNVDRIMPEHQHMEPGDFWALNAKTGIAVRAVEPLRHIVLQWEPAKSTWTFALRPLPDGSTRLISRNRLPGGGPAFWAMAAVMEPASLVMERKMLLGIKERAERTARESTSVEAGGARGDGV